MTNASADDIDRMLESLGCAPGERVHVIAGDGCKASLRRSMAGDAVYIMKIISEPQCRGRGNASELLRLICEAADDNSIALFLEIERIEGGSLDENEFADWYWRHGFRGEAEEMIREPVGGPSD